MGGYKFVDLGRWDVYTAKILPESFLKYAIVVFFCRVATQFFLAHLAELILLTRAQGT